MRAKQRKRKTYSILTVMLLVSILCLSAVGALMLVVAGRSLNGLERYIYEKEYEETLSAVGILDRDIEILHNLMYSQLSSSYLLKSLMYMNDNALNSQYYDSITSVRAQLFTVEMALDLAENITIYVPAHRRAITSPSSSRYDESVALWLEEILGREPAGVFIDDGQLLFMLLDTFGATRSADHTLIMSKVPQYIMVHYLGRFTQENNEAQFLLFVEDAENTTLFAASKANLLPREVSGELSSLIRGDESGSETFLQGEEHYLVTWRTASIAQLKLCQLTPLALMDEQMQDQRFPIIFGLTLAMLSIVALVSMMYLIIQKPIRQMKRALGYVEHGDFSTRIETTWSTEFQLVFTQFNSMAAHTQRLIEQEYELRLLNSKAELKQMQYQISPHFLYNTYFFLRATLLDEEYEQAEQMADLMGRFLRYITTSGYDQATLREEIDHALAYLQIQQLRFHNRVQTNVEDCPLRLLERQVPKLIVQPLIENAFEHGIKHLNERGIVRLHIAWEEGRLSLTVEDNGTHITDAQIAHIQSMLDDDTASFINDGIALANIHKRLKITYPNGGGLMVSRSPLGGLRSLIYIQWS